VLRHCLSSHLDCGREAGDGGWPTGAQAGDQAQAGLVAEGREHGSLPAISYVTGTLNVRFLAPTPLYQPIVLRAHVEELYPKRARVLCAVYSGDKKTAEGDVMAVRFRMDKSLGAGG